MAVVEEFAHVFAALTHALEPRERDHSELVCSAFEPCINRAVTLDRVRKAQQSEFTT
jgi:hypothetical protein